METFPWCGLWSIDVHWEGTSLNKKVALMLTRSTSSQGCSVRVVLLLLFRAILGPVISWCISRPQYLCGVGFCDESAMPMTDDSWPRGWHLSLSQFWLVWSLGESSSGPAVAMVHGEGVLLVPHLSSDLSRVPSWWPSCYASVFITSSSGPLRTLLVFLLLRTSQGHTSITHAQTLGTPFSHGYVHSGCLCQNGEESCWYLGSRVKWTPSSLMLYVPLVPHYLHWGANVTKW